MANEEHVAILNKGFEVWNQWRRENPNIVPDLSETAHTEAILTYVALSRRADIGEENLFEAALREAALSRANLNGANLSRANLRRANLSRANLNGANLNGANLSWANLSRADLSWANLSRADLSWAALNGGNWTEAICSFTTFGDVDLSQVKGLETVSHRGPSTIGIDTIYRSGGNIPKAFLRGAGVPDHFITFMYSMPQAAFEFDSCYIIYSDMDKEFVASLHLDLLNNGVRCFSAPEGTSLLGIERAIRHGGKILVVLSKHALRSSWVEREVLAATTKEDQQDRETTVLFPIVLDEAVMNTNVLWASTIRDSRHIADFPQWKNHDSYRKAFDKLMGALKGKS